jgi:hypothetical protein
MTVANRTLMNSISWSTLSDILANLDGSGPIILINCGTSLCAMVQNLFMAFIVLIKKTTYFYEHYSKKLDNFFTSKKLCIHKNGLAFWNMLTKKSFCTGRHAPPSVCPARTARWPWPTPCIRHRKPKSLGKFLHSGTTCSNNRLTCPYLTYLTFTTLTLSG